MASGHFIRAGVLGLLMLGACASADEPSPTAVVGLNGCYTVFFDSDSTSITATADSTVRQLASVVKGMRTSVTITAHTDRSGSPAYNVTLSQRRAESLKARLVELGVSAGIINAIGKGETQPLVQTADGVKEPQNRRADLVFN